MLDYPRQGTTLTLGEGLAEYHAHHRDLVESRAASPAAREFFRCHDVAHVVFGCGTSLPDEAAVKIWSLFGTTGGLRLLRDYRLPESREIYARLSWGDVASTAVRSTGLVPRVLWRCARMRARWPWHDFDAWLPIPLRDLRHAFGIRVLERSARARAPRRDARAASGSGSGAGGEPPDARRRRRPRPRPRARP